MNCVKTKLAEFLGDVAKSVMPITTTARIDQYTVFEGISLVHWRRTLGTFASGLHAASFQRPRILLPKMFERVVYVRMARKIRYVRHGLIS